MPIAAEAVVVVAAGIRVGSIWMSVVGHLRIAVGQTWAHRVVVVLLLLRLVGLDSSSSVHQ